MEVSRKINPPCEVCGTETLHHSDHSGSWNKCPTCEWVQDIRRTPGGRLGFLTDFAITEKERYDAAWSDWRPNKVYVASSWRNIFQVAVVAALQSAKIDCYDFKKPKLHNDGFHWSEVMPSYRGVDQMAAVQAEEYLKALKHPRSVEGFTLDFEAMEECDTCILVLPCNRSAHLELGWFVGQGKRTAILLEHGEPVIPELMYKMVDYIAPTLFDLLGWLGVED